MKDNKNNKETWLQKQPIEFIKNLKTVYSITYPNGKKEYLKGNFYIL
jgi:hypothetical protein